MSQNTARGRECEESLHERSRLAGGSSPSVEVTYKARVAVAVRASRAAALRLPL